MTIAPFPALKAAGLDPDIIQNAGGNILKGFLAGRQIADEDQAGYLKSQVGGRMAAGDVAGASAAAFRGGDIKTGMDVTNWDTDRRTKALDLIYHAAKYADTPAKWKVAIDNVSRAFGPQMVRGYEAYESRPNALSALEQAQMKLKLDADKRAAAMHGPQLRMAQLQAQTLQRELDEPKLSQTIVPPGGALVTRNPRTNEAEIIHTQPKEADAATKRAIWEAQDEMPVLDSTIDALKEASGLNRQAYSGWAAGARGAIGAKTPDWLVPDAIANPQAGQATARYQQIMNQEAIAAMSKALKGATTNEEMQRFLKDIADLSLPPDVRQKAINSLLKLAERHRQVKADRIRELGGRMPGAGGTPQSVSAPEATKTINGKQYMKIDGEWYEAGP